jgi:uncharacterized membrane protein
MANSTGNEAKGNLPGPIDEALQRVVETTLATNLEKLPPQDRQTVITMVAGMMTGPLPPPAVAAQYEKLCPGFVDRSLKMAEIAQQAEIDAKADERQKNQNYRVFGMTWAGLVTLTLVLVGGYIAVNVNVYVGVVTALISFVASAVAAFINGRPLADETKEAQPSTAQPQTAKTQQPIRKRTKR